VGEKLAIALQRSRGRENHAADFHSSRGNTAGGIFRVAEFHSGIFRAVEFYSWRWRAEEMTIGSKQSYNGSVMALTPRRKTSSRCAVEFSQLALADFPCRWIIAETLPIL